VELLQKYARSQFPNVKYMEYAVTVETYTLTKANNLVLNVDGCIGSLFLDLLSSCAMFTPQEINEIIEIGYLNGLFVLARSIGLIGYVLTHYAAIRFHSLLMFPGVATSISDVSSCCSADTHSTRSV
jgi:citrate synthase